MADGNQTIVLTSSFDRRQSSSNINPVWQKTITATYDADDTTDTTLSIPIDGVLQRVILKVPSFSNSITTRLYIKDSNGNTVFDSSAQAKNTTYKFSTTEPLCGICSAVVSISGVAGGTGGSIVVTLRGI